MISKTRSNTPILDDTDAHGSKISKKQALIEGYDKIRPGFAGDFTGGKKSRVGEK